MAIVPVDTSESPYSCMISLGLGDVKLMGFLGSYIKKMQSVTLPRMYELLESTGRLDNLRIAAGKKEGSFKGFRFNDTDVYKWVEATSFALKADLENEITKNLEEILSLVIEEIKGAQDEDGYLDSFYPPSRKNERWSDLAWSHEMYCAGHLIQAAIAHRRAIGELSLFNVAKRFANHIENLFGQEPTKRKELDGHPEVEMALVELYRETHDVKYLKLADYFIRARGRGYASKSDKYIGASPRYFVDHEPFVEMKELVGHAVRMLYLCCGATDVYLETGARDLWLALERLWKDLVETKLYVTGGCGSRPEWEAFGSAYDLPNKTAYAETCAAIANFMWNYRMFLATGEGKYVDLMERVLYNNLLSGISLDGKSFFYDNPLESDGTHQRSEWFECACCPPNIARLLSSLPAYVCTRSKQDGLYVNLYEKCSINFNSEHGFLKLVIDTDYPWDGQIFILVTDSLLSGPIPLFLRIPEWAQDFTLKVNGETVMCEPRNGYVMIKRLWKRNDTVEIEFPINVTLLHCHPFVEANRGKVAIARGPLIYCAEYIDNKFDPRFFVLDLNSNFMIEWQNIEDLGKLIIIRGKGLTNDANFWEGRLYVKSYKRGIPREINLIPYYMWANRKNSGPMVVWFVSIG